MAAEGYLDDVGDDLRRSDEGPKANCRRKAGASCLEGGEQVHPGHGCRDRPAAVTRRKPAAGRAFCPDRQDSR